jgi:Polyketide cyclase / dehydrase and lipid transport
MASQVIDVEARSGAPREAVWALVADGRSWGDWGPWQKVELEREGSPPLRNYEASVTLTDADGGTAIHWRSQFDPRIPGTGALFRSMLGRFIADVTERLAREAERRADA